MTRNAVAPAFFLLLLSGFCSALVVGPRIYEQDDFGDIIFSEFTYSLSADCNASTISLIVMNESNKPVQEAQTYLKYVDFATPLIANVKTDKDGFALMKLPGNVKLMRGLFVLVIEKRGFRSKEVHFDLSPCFTNGTIPAKPSTKPANQTSNATNQTQPAKPPAQNMSGGSQPNANLTNASNQSGVANETESRGEGGTNGVCLSMILFLLVPALLLCRGWINKTDRRIARL